MTPPIDSLPDDLERAARIDAEAKATSAAANVSSAEALIAHLKLAIEKMRRELYGSRSEHGRKLLDQMELELEDVEAAAAEDEIAAKMGAIVSVLPANIQDRDAGERLRTVMSSIMRRRRGLIWVIWKSPVWEGAETPDPLRQEANYATSPLPPR